AGFEPAKLSLRLCRPLPLAARAPTQIAWGRIAGMTDDAPARTPLDLLGRLATNEAQLAPGLRLVESYTMRGMLKLLWHGDPTAEEVVLCAGGGMGGFLGPAHGLYLHLGKELARHGVGVVCVD